MRAALSPCDPKASRSARLAYIRAHCPVYAALKPLHDRSRRDSSYHFKAWGALSDGRTVEIVAHADSTCGVAEWIYTNKPQHRAGFHPAEPFSIRVYAAGVDPLDSLAPCVYPPVDDRMFLEALLRGAGFIQ